MKRWQIVVVIVTGLIVVAVVGSGAWYVVGPCGRVPVESAYTEATAIIASWNSVESSGFSNGSISNSLTAWRGGFNEIVMPACLRPARESILNGMTTVIKAYQDAASNPNVAEVYLSFRNYGYKQMRQGGAELIRINGCAPFCQ